MVCAGVRVCVCVCVCVYVMLACYGVKLKRVGLSLLVDTVTQQRGRVIEQQNSVCGLIRVRIVRSEGELQTATSIYNVST